MRFKICYIFRELIKARKHWRRVEHLKKLIGMGELGTYIIFPREINLKMLYIYI